MLLELLPVCLLVDKSMQFGIVILEFMVILRSEADAVMARGIHSELTIKSIIT